MIAEARYLVLDAVKAALPPDTVGRAYGVNLDGVESPVVMVYTSKVAAQTVACPSDVVHVEVLVVTHLREPGTADDALDALGDAVLAGVDTIRTARRGDLERVDYLNTWPAYRLPVEVTP